MKIEEIKNDINSILGEVNFEGHFEIVVNCMSENQKESLISWIKRCKEGKEQVASSKIDKELIAFFFKPNINNIRGILTKKKGSFLLHFS